MDYSMSKRKLKVSFVKDSTRLSMMANRNGVKHVTGGAFL